MQVEDAAQPPSDGNPGPTTVSSPAVNSITLSSRRPPRRIILFSDGTGNSSGKLFKTNVWRLYEALDLGPGDGSAKEQIALYSNGVGTSSFRPLAMIGGIFGLGLKDNVLELYKYLCRNWQPGDETYLFGFSRGAFTIRLLAGLIVSQGLLRGSDSTLPPDEDRLAYLARAAYRSFSGEAWPNRWPSKMIAVLVRAVRDFVIAVHRKLTGRLKYDEAHNCMTDIDFVGVWDTVAAYGGPIVEITRGIDDWIWPLTMPNYQLSPRVLQARHALSLDDERDAFTPLLWDEVREELLIRWGGPIRVNDGGKIVEEVREVREGRLKQVWFSGMHSDVGGGYPDETLSYVSLMWMIDELDGALRLLPDAVRRFQTMANSFGPIHDSRSGLGSYYRFQPRRISAMTDWLHLPLAKSKPTVSPEQALAFARSTRSSRDPEVADRAFKLPKRNNKATDADIDALAAHVRNDHGLLRSVRVHESAISRIISGTDNYAPLSLPQRYSIVFAKQSGVSLRQLDTETAKQVRDDQRSDPSIDSWHAHQSRIWDMVWWRRIQYFSTVFLSVLLLTLPLWGSWWSAQGFPGRCEDSRCVVRPALSLANRISGRYAGPWIDAVSDHVVLSSVVAAMLVLLTAYGHAYTLRLRGRARQAWRVALGIAGNPPDLGRRSVARISERPGYQTFVKLLKWRLAPAVAALFMVGGVALVTLSTFAQLFVFPAVEERQSALTMHRDADPAVPFRLFDIRDPNRSLIVRDGDRLVTTVSGGTTYALRLTIVHRGGPEAEDRDRWHDGSYPGSPEIGRGADLPWIADLLGVPFRRVLMAGWLEPLIEVRNSKLSGLQTLGSKVDIIRPAFTCDQASGSYVAALRPEASGTLTIFVNDTVVPWRRTAFYANNRGLALVEVFRGSDLPPVPSVRGLDPIKCVASGAAAPARASRRAD